MIITTGIYYIGVPVNDVEHAVKFHTEVLGMKIAKLNRDDMGDHLNRADPRSGNGTVVLFQRPTPIEKDALKDDGATHHAFTVSPEDFESAAQKMKDWGVQSIPIVVEKNYAAEPYGAKGVGEMAVFGIAPAIANAVARAIGVRVKDLPISPGEIARANQTSNTMRVICGNDRC